MTSFFKTRGVVYGAREAHNLTGWVQLLAPQHFYKKTTLIEWFFCKACTEQVHAELAERAEV